jgi:hypothetical protein
MQHDRAASTAAVHYSNPASRSSSRSSTALLDRRGALGLSIGATG